MLIKLYTGTEPPFLKISIPQVNVPLVSGLLFTEELFMNVLVIGPQSALNPPILKLAIGSGSMVTEMLCWLVQPFAVSVYA